MVVESFMNSDRTPPYIDTYLQILPNFGKFGKNALRYERNLEPQSRFFGDKPLEYQAVCPQNGAAALKGSMGVDIASLDSRFVSPFLVDPLTKGVFFSSPGMWASLRGKNIDNTKKTYNDIITKTTN